MSLDRDRPKRSGRPERPWVIPVIVAGALAVLAFALVVLAVTGQSLF